MTPIADIEIAAEKALADYEARNGPIPYEQRPYFMFGFTDGAIWAYGRARQIIREET